METGNHLLLLLSLQLLLLCYPVRAYPDGAPRSTCISLFAKHGGHQQETSASPYIIQLSNSSYNPDQEITVTLTSKTGNHDFRGFVLIAQRDAEHGDQEVVVGKFTSLPSPAKGLYWWPSSADNINPGINCVTHKTNEVKKSVQFTWKAPLTSVGDIIFRAGFVETFEQFWALGTEAKLTALVPGPPPAPYESKVFNTFSPGLSIDDECGKTKGCMLYPDNCRGSSCRYAVTYKPNALNTGVDFEMTGISPGYISLAFSDDVKMTNDQTFSCIEGGEVKYDMQSGYNPSLYNHRVPITGVTGIQVKRDGERINCRFSRPTQMTTIKVAGHPEVAGNLTIDLTKEWYLMLAFGKIYKGSTVMSQHHVLPLVSTRKVNVLKAEIVTARTFSTVLKVHASMGVTGWLALAGLGIMIARFYRQTLHHKICDIALWFEIHRTFMFVAVLLSIGIIIVSFSYIQAWTKHAGVHAVFGIVATGLGIIQVVGGICRPDPGSEKRHIFNWIHRSSGLLGFACAVVCIILSFQVTLIEEQIRLRGTVIVVVWVVFYIIWALVLQLIECKTDRAANKVESVTQNGVSIQDKSSPQSTNTHSLIHLIWLALGVIMVLVLLVLMLVYINLA